MTMNLEDVVLGRLWSLGRLLRHCGGLPCERDAEERSRSKHQRRLGGTGSGGAGIEASSADEVQLEHGPLFPSGSGSAAALALRGAAVAECWAKTSRQAREKTGSPSRARTCDNSINSRMLYQLSYRGSAGAAYSRLSSDGNPLFPACIPLSDAIPWTHA